MLYVKRPEYFDICILPHRLTIHRSCAEDNDRVIAEGSYQVRNVQTNDVAYLTREELDGGYEPVEMRFETFAEVGGVKRKGTT